MKRVAQDVDVVLVEIGGTVGDIESLPFLEAIRQMRHEQGRGNCIFRARHPGALDRRRAGDEDQAHQHSVKELRALRYSARHIDLPLRTSHSAGDEREDRPVLRRRRGSRGHGARREIGLCRPHQLRHEGVDEIVLRLLKLDAPPRDLAQWIAMLDRLENRAAKSTSAWSASTWNTRIPIRA